jgi:hypothetical protein
VSDLEKFRRETRAWLEANCPPEMRRPMASDEETFWGGRNTKFSSEPQRVWFERMRDKGWTVPHWPKEYGGGGLDPEEAKIVRQEMTALGARQPLVSFGISMLGPALLKYGTDAQKKENLPKIAGGLIRWCQGYSEPNAGSDLASLQTRAESDGDDSSSMARRYGRLTPTTQTGFSAWCGPMRAPRSMTALVLFFSTWLQRASRPNPFC